MKLENFNTYFFFAVLILVSAFSLALFWPFVSAIFIAALFAAMFQKPYMKLLAKVNGHAAFASTIMCLLVTVVIVLPIGAIGGVVAGEISSAVTKLSSNGSQEQQVIMKTLNSVLETPLGTALKAQASNLDINEEIANVVKNVGDKVFTVATKTYQGVVGSIIWIFVMFFTLFYFFIDGKRFVARLMDLSPLRNKHEAMLIDKFVSMTRATLKGTLIIGVIQGVLGGLAFVIAGVASPMFWMVVMIFLSIIPAVGSALVIFPAAIIMFLLGFTWQSVFLILVGVVISSIDNVLRPKLVGKDTQMHSLLIFFGTIGGMSLFGIIGFIVGPIILALAIALWHIYATEFKSQLKKYNA